MQLCSIGGLKVIRAEWKIDIVSLQKCSRYVSLKIYAVSKQ